eukprot:scaffold220343_cov25-Tisochrysis_lutea.AAC.3
MWCEVGLWIVWRPWEGGGFLGLPVRVPRCRVRTPTWVHQMASSYSICRPLASSSLPLIGPRALLPPKPLARKPLLILLDPRGPPPGVDGEAAPLPAESRSDLSDSRSGKEPARPPAARASAASTGAARAVRKSTVGGWVGSDAGWAVRSPEQCRRRQHGCGCRARARGTGEACTAEAAEGRATHRLKPRATRTSCIAASAASTGGIAPTTSSPRNVSMPRRASISAKIPRIAGVCCGISVVERETSETLSSEAGTPRAESSRRRRACGRREGRESGEESHGKGAHTWRGGGHTCIESASSTPPAPPPTTTSWIGLRSASAAAAVSRSAEDAGSVRPRFQLMVLPRRPTNESAGSLTGGISWGGESPQPASAASATRCRMESQRAQKPSMGLTGVTPLHSRARERWWRVS